MSRETCLFCEGTGGKLYYEPRCLLAWCQHCDGKGHIDRIMIAPTLKGRTATMGLKTDLPNLFEIGCWALDLVLGKE